MSQPSSFQDTLASMSQDVDIQILNTSMKNKHLTLAQMRGVIPLFNHYFKQVDQFGNKKKISRDEKQARWISYKNKIWRDYKRAIKGTFASEQALIRRYSEPLTFLKYKLKRASNLKVSDLSVEDQQYYKEIGGLDDINALIARQHNIDSINKITSRNNKKRKITDVYELEYERNRQRNHNIHPHNIHHQNSPSNSALNLPEINAYTNIVMNDPLACTNIADESKEKVDKAIEKLNDDLDVFEQEQLLKKRIEAYEITQEKVKALMEATKNVIETQPAMIGCIPAIGGLDDQLMVCFDFWLNKHKYSIKNKVVDFTLFMEQIMILKSDPKDFVTFLQKWKMLRIFNNDCFDPVWNFITTELSIECKKD